MNANLFGVHGSALLTKQNIARVIADDSAYRHGFVVGGSAGANVSVGWR